MNLESLNYIDVNNYPYKLSLSEILDVLHECDKKLTVRVTGKSQDGEKTFLQFSLNDKEEQ